MQLSVLSRCPVCSTELGVAPEGADIKCPICGFISTYTRAGAKGARAISFQVVPLATEIVVNEQAFTIKKLAYSGTVSDVWHEVYVLPGIVFPERRLVTGKYTNTSSVPLSIKMRVIDLDQAAPNNIVAEEVAATREPNTTWDFWLPRAGSVPVTMPNRDWRLALQMLGYYG